MDKVNEFEYAADEYRVGGYRPRWNAEARTHYLYSSAEELLDNVEDLQHMVRHHKEYQRPRLDTLDNYYEGNNDSILRKERRQEKHLSDHRSPHAFAEYVSQFIQGYMTGIPIKVQHKDESVSEAINAINDETDADAHNNDLILDLSIYGRAYEMPFRTQEENRLAILSPLETFVIYTDTVEQEPIAGVRYYTRAIGKEKQTYVELYTADAKYVYKAAENESFTLSLESAEEHSFGGVPIIEYSNNRFRQGDFEKVLGLIDLYDAAQSDTANYMTDLNDAMLKITGDLEIDVEEAKKMKDANILFLQAAASIDGRSGNVDADYIYKQYDVSGVEKYKDRIASDIHKFTNTPDMNDDNFGGQQTGESMKYKLFGLEQKRAIKERLFKRSLMQRYRLISNLLSKLNRGFDPAGLSFQFTPNLPQSIKSELESFTKAGGKLSNETLLSTLSFVTDPQAEIERMEQEQQEARNTLDSYYPLGGANDGEQGQSDLLEGQGNRTRPIDA